MACQCNHNNLLEETLDVTTIPHSVRHPAILGAISALPVLGSILLKAPHKPSPLLAEVAALEGSFTHEVVQDGPSEWLVRISREG